jgi:Xaa-Pro dipeptidase
MDGQLISRIHKLDGIKKAKQVDAFLLTSPSSVRYLSGYFFYFEYGPSPFQLLPAILLVAPGHNATLVLADNEIQQVRTVDPLIFIAPYASYTHESPLAFTKESLLPIDTFLNKNKITQARIGIEERSLPIVLSRILSERYPGIEWVDVSDEIASLRVVKDNDEIKLIRQAAHLADIGQVAVIKHARRGMTELELFSLVHGDMEAVTGHRLPLMADLSSGRGTAGGGGMPTHKRIGEGDLVLCDLTPCLNGYWGDSCNTFALGEPTTEQKRTFVLVREALELGIEAIRPGVQAKEIDRLMREQIGNYPHHSGHGVGTAYHEDPRIVPYNDQELLPGMVIALEPAIYTQDYGIRLEHLMLVTESGCDVLTKFKHRFEK